MKITKDLFAKLKGKSIYAYTLKNSHGMEVTCIDYGCIITKILIPDVNGNTENVVLGFDTLEDYQNYSPYFGAVCGRVAGRISRGQFELNGKTYQLATNNDNNHLHGGIEGFDKVVWSSRVIENEHEGSVIFTYLSKDSEEGYPGNLEVKVTYTLSEDNAFTITYEGETDKTTIVNLTNHTYFNLSGNAKRDILNHQLQLKSDQFIELNDELLPTGEHLPVEGTPFDFREGRKIVDGSYSSHPQNQLAGEGYDHPFLLNENNKEEIILIDEESGRRLVIETDQPCVVLYTGTQLQDHFKIGQTESRKYLGLCLETQGVPDAINHPHFPSIVLEKGEKYFSQTKYSFGFSN
ncbi:galactose mutarotase [Anaerobacillus alkalilacustris]|uniref:Aldose 1-epimerase n=1 Tax=Anaerobacillus alkalilacustris TaxID=393763 RepID=A0A1S2LXU2_9BACI|nr:aldose epimerase family protein [Anaerobacillus alkalilacustris]OIJ17040.1 galactose mutarotase [Anaerobacillus alkalilacustris]